MPGPLKNSRHELFAQALARGRSEVDAYHDAGFSRNRKSASRLLLTKADVRRRVQELKDRISERLVVTEARILQEAERLGTSDIRQLLDKDGNLLPPSQWPDDAAAAVAGIEFTETKSGKGGSKVVLRGKRLKLWDKVGALDKVMRHRGMFKKDNTQVGEAAAAEAQALAVANRDEITRDAARRICYVLAEAMRLHKRESETGGEHGKQQD